MNLNATLERCRITMSRSRAAIHGLLAALVAVIAIAQEARALALLLPPTAQGWTPHQGVPPANIEAFPEQYAYLKYPQSDLLGRVSLDMSAKRVTIRWAVGDAAALKDQVFATSYWPTTFMVSRATNKLLVAGKRRNGNTVVELWTVQKPLVLYPSGGGTPGIQDGIVQDITTLVDEAVQGRDMVQRLIEKPGQPTVVLAQYYDSHSIFALDFTTSQTVTTLVASAAGGSGVLAFSQCARPFERWWSANHVTAGYVYVFTDDSQEKVYVLKDSDRNGSLDAELVLTGHDWTSNGWASPSSYIP